MTNGKPWLSGCVTLTWSAVALLAASSMLQAGPVYDSVYTELTRHDNRLPGSEGCKASLEHLDKVLKDAGLETHRQTFNTLVSETIECRFTVDGTEVSPVFALGPNGAANNTTRGEVLKGPLVYLGQGTLAEMKGLPVDGCIAILDFDSPHMMQVLSQGALAVVFVGDGTESQWDVRSQFSSTTVELPRLFMAREEAEKRGLLSNQPDRMAEVSVTCRWKDEEAVNLWVEIPGEPGTTFSFDEEEAIILSAVYDTFGTVPELSPSERRAANCALLAEVATMLKSQPLKRSVFVVFFGSHYSMQDGARMFYFALERSTTKANDQTLQAREEGYGKLLADSQARLATLDVPAETFFKQDSPVLKDVTSRIEKRLSARVSVLNYELRLVREALLPLRRMKTMLPLDKVEFARLEAEEIVIKNKRMTLNAMRGQINDEAITNQVLFVKVANEERDAINREISDYEGLVRHNLTHQELGSRLAAKRIMGHYDLDLADPESEWILNIQSIGSQMFYHTIGVRWGAHRLGDYVKNLVTIGEMDRELGGKGAPGDGLFDAPATSLVMPGLFCTPSIRSSPARAANALQIFGYHLANVGEPLNGDEMPYRQDVDLSALIPRLLNFTVGLAADPDLSQPCPMNKPKRQENSVIHFKGEGGHRFLTFARGSETELAGVPEDGVAFIPPRRYNESPAIAGHSYLAASRIMAAGNIFIPLIYSHVELNPFGYHSHGGLRNFPRGNGWVDPRLIYGQGGIVNAPFVPGAFETKPGTIANGRTEAIMKAFQVLGNGFYGFYVPEEDPFKVYEKEGLLLLGSNEATPRGEGVPLDERPLYSFNALRKCAEDYLFLNQSRLQLLREKNIVNDSLESLHADAEQHWQDAVAAREAKDYGKAVAHEAISAGISSRVAPALREVTNDMVRAVVLLLLLTLPFAFIMERLFISATSIYRQVIGFVAFFIGSFALLYLVHPAFQIASSPMIIFLAFVIILLSVMVIGIVMSKFKKELRAMQGLSTSAHGVASDSSTSMAAVLIGISGMRNRPIKTFLTALTIILLTFAIVVFASFTPTTGVTTEYMGKGEGANRIELHRFSGLEISTTLFESLSALFADDWKVFPREAFFRGPKSVFEGALLAVYNEQNHQWQRLDAMVGLDAEELNFNADLERALPGFRDYSGELPPIFLSQRMSEAMGVKTGDVLRVKGKAYAFAGVTDASVLDQLEFIDRSKIMPPDFEASKSELQQGEGGSGQQDLSKDEMVDTTRFTYNSARGVAITTLGAMDELADQMQPVRMNAIMMYAGEQASVEETAEEIAKMFVGPVMAKGAGGANKFFFSNSLQATGFSVVIVPLLLGGLIIFNSLLGSIVEREKEIFTYSAMGLSPPSVGALFFAESGVYAILGGMGGYLFSQLVAKAVTLGGEMGWFVPPEMNFSSLSSVLTSFVVMGMVMVSTIYPAIKAGRSANPGVARKWKMPAPKDNKIDFVFPFTVSADDMGGILAFISEHFDNHGDASLGCFAAANPKLFRTDDGAGMGMQASISLAPFDLGVMQQFRMFSRPSELEGIDEIVVQLGKVSGTQGAWLRGNRVFVDDLREQFLLWRSLPVSTVMHYRELSEKATADETGVSQQATEKES